MQRVSLHTLGCKLNYAETSTIGRQFVERGYRVVQPDEPTDVFVLNTCSVTERADRECRQIIRRMLRHSPDAYVVVVGCYAQLQPEEIGAIEGVDLVIGAKEKFRIFDHAKDFTKRKLSQVFVSCIDDAIEFESASSAEVGGRTRAFLKIQDGCDYPCSFCTIPLARGSSRSLPLPSVLAQARRLVAQGFKEIVLTGVNVGDYRPESEGRLLDVLRKLDEIEGLDRLRISSIEPNLLTEEMVSFILSSRRICNHFHIPLQSGSDEVLALMRRRYKSQQYARLVESIKRQDIDAAIGVDVIVGFPGETDELFEETYRFLADLPVSYLHVFTYSERARTPAANFDGIVDATTRARRSERLRLLSYKKRAAFYRSMVGRTMPVLFESAGHEDDMSGLTSNYVRVHVTPSTNIAPNTLVPVHITEAGADGCLGKVFHHVSFMKGDFISDHANMSTHHSPNDSLVMEPI